MSKYSQHDAEKKARQIFQRFGGQIREACAGTVVPEDFLGGFVGVEAGVDHSGHISTSGKRFEQGVYHHLLAVRDGLLKSYNGIYRGDIAGVPDAAIVNLATSWGLTQIMGWHMIHNLVGAIEDLRDPDKHLGYAVRLLNLTAGQHLRSRNWGNVLRIWNSGSANGKTYDPNYVDNAMAVKAAYGVLMRSRSDASAPSTTPSAEAAATPPVQEGSLGNDSAVETPSRLILPDETLASDAANDPLHQPTDSAQPPIAGEGRWVEGTLQKFDRVNDLVSGVTQRADSVKAARAAMGGTVKQIIWAVFCFLVGMPWYEWLGVAVITGAIVLVYIHRQTVLGKIRELAGKAEPQTVTAKTEVVVEEKAA